MKKQLAWFTLTMLLGVIALATGCAESPAAVRADRSPRHLLRTAHYAIYTTIADDLILNRFMRLMEAAYAQYAALCTPSIADDRPMEIDLFADAQEWRQFTLETAGPEANVYVQVNRGGYAIDDRFVCWLFDEPTLYSVAAHEGFHQYVAHYFQDRPPPALEEGLATTFENVRITPDRIVFDHSNPRRQTGLKRAIAAKAFLPLETLLQMHAGDVAGRGSLLSEGFYGQCWALARLLLDSPANRSGLLQMLHDLRDGHPRVNLGPKTRQGVYRPAMIRPLLEAYIWPDWLDFCNRYRLACASATDNH